jgi:hypothetical protein
LPIPFDGGPAAVGCGAVQLHGDALLSPQGVDSYPADPGVDLGQRQAGGLAELEESILEDAYGPGELGKVASESSAEVAGSTPSFPEHRLELVAIEETPVVGFGERTPKLPRRDDRGEVDEGPADGRHREASVLGSFRSAGVVGTNTRQ